MIIGFGYRAQVGKDTAADFLVKHYGFRKISFATVLKEVVQTAFSFTDQQLHDNNYKEAPDLYWDRYIKHDNAEGGRVMFTPRYALQQVGTELFRNHIHPDFWVHAMWRRINQEPGYTNWVIPDTRYPNEADSILERKGLLFRIDRDDSGVKSGNLNHISEEIMSTYTKWTGVLDNNNTLKHFLGRELHNKVIFPHIFESNSYVKI